MAYPKIISLVVMAFLTACTSNIPTNSASIGNQVEIKHDQFKNQTWIETPLYLSRQGITDTFPVKISLRALYKNGRANFIQLYVTKMDVTWGFYHSANGQDGYSFKFVKIDGVVDSLGGMVTTNEHFALNVPREYLEKMAREDWQIKVYGKRNEGVFIVPSSLSKGFLEKLNCYENNQCR
jgi:hypothetical protein